MKKVFRGSGLVMLGAFLTLVGCGGAMQEEKEGAPANEPTQGVNQVPQPGGEQPGDTPEANDKGGDVEALTSCSYVQYCNAPGSDGTVCILNHSCNHDTAVKECERETYAICGAPVQPWVYY